MEFLKQLKWSIIVLALAYVVLGVVLILYPVQTQTAVTYILAIALIAMGIINLIQYARLDATALVNSYDLVIGFSGIIGGILIIINIEKFAQMLWIALGFMVLISGVLKLQSSVNLMRLKSTSWHIPFALALINIVFGVIMLIDPFSDELFLIMLGIGFIFSGVTDIIVTLMVSARLKTVTDIIMSSGNDGAGSQTM
ncbi:MAG: DUF308 domain-containing protein [Eubacterium sp.]|nr:DUF308 domain-containing protein [Eubacterium sp.]